MEKSAPARARPIIKKSSTVSVVAELSSWFKYKNSLRGRRDQLTEEKRPESEFKKLDEQMKACQELIDSLVNDLKGRKVIYVDTDWQFSIVLGLNLGVRVIKLTKEEEVLLKNQDGETSK